MREIRTPGSTGRGSETGLRRWLDGHEAGNGGHSQTRAYGVPRRPPTLPSHCLFCGAPVLSERYGILRQSQVDAVVRRRADQPRLRHPLIGG